MDRCDHRPDRHPDIDQHGLGQLEACFDRLRHRVRGASAIEMRRVRCIARTRDNQQVAPLGSCAGHQFVGRGGIVERYYQGAGGLQMAVRRKPLAPAASDLSVSWARGEVRPD